MAQGYRRSKVLKQIVHAVRRMQHDTGGMTDNGH